jgi:uncharacterized lipoprotein YddW (UPF0748 family)
VISPQSFAGLKVLGWFGDVRFQPRSLLRKLLWLGLGLALCIAFHQAPAYQTTAPKGQELRAVWMTGSGASFLHRTTLLDEAFHNLAELHFNTVYPNVWSRAQTLHPSTFVERITGDDHRIVLPGQDVLRSLTQQGHRQGISVIPWFEYGLMVPASSSLAKRHPEWITQDITGKTITRPHSQNSLASRLPQPLREWAFTWTGANLVWLNPMHPQVQAFLTQLIVEVVQKYDVDGIQLDDHFGMPVSLGYDRFTEALFRKEHGYPPPTDARDPEWMAWRAQKLTALMAKISKAVKAKKANCLISLSPNPPAFAYREYLQDWPTWIRSGWVNDVVVQVYRTKPVDLEAELSQTSLQQLRQQVPVSIGLFTGSTLSARPLSHLAKQVERVRAWGYDGVAFFHWEPILGLFKKESNTVIHQTFRTLFPAPSLPTHKLAIAASTSKLTRS